ncbi:hypothetical protein CI238_09319, partial [Colletotrichum incanum]
LIVRTPTFRNSSTVSALPWFIGSPRSCCLFAGAADGSSFCPCMQATRVEPVLSPPDSRSTLGPSSSRAYFPVPPLLSRPSPANPEPAA